ncbi:MAG: magnesium/cobalt transporter CorA, partial [Candidatus Methylomirabilis sp.]|nr:magnesium/cobalt transporter CorA [Deltaproteobacteria bacterium]
MDATDAKPRWWSRARRERPHRTLKMPPGTLLHDPEAPPPIVTVFGFSPESYVEECVKSALELPEFLRRWPTAWVNVDGLGDAGAIAAVGEIFGVHRLALEDVLHVVQRSKVETYEDKLYIVARMPEMKDEERLDSEQFSLFLGRGWVLTFQERPGDCFDNIRDRIRHKRGRVRDAGADYLAYALLDSLTDSYFPILEKIGERLEDLEDEIVETTGRELVASVHDLKRDLLTVRRAMWPQREALNTLVRDRNELIRDETRMYLRDLYDHTIQLIDLTETHREVCADLMDLY